MLADRRDSEEFVMGRFRGNISYQGGSVFDGKAYSFNSPAQAEAFEFKTDAILGAIDRNPVGRILIREINSSPNDVAIRPLAPFLGGRATVTEFEDDISKLSPTFFYPVINDPAAPRVASVNFDLQVGTVVPTGVVSPKPVPPAVLRAVPLWRGFVSFVAGNKYIIMDPSTRKIVDVLPRSGELREHGRSTDHGPGSFVDIWYNPDTFETYTAKSDIEQIKTVTIAGRKARLISNHFQADDALFHELVHALRGLRGFINTRPGGPFDNREDLYAIMLTNIYLSAAGRNADRRGSHAARWEPLPPKYAADALNFYNDATGDIADLFSEMPTLCGSIALLTGVWNPLLSHAMRRAFAER